ncbi:DUF2809 domain-containing protein [Agromyces terreus]|uniref:ribosomal maturation YjgA family protein n=1 Tax=Agromyces terreus TaxID=424795 RepID=UPI0031DC071F
MLLAGLALQLPDRTVAIDLAGSALYASLVGLIVAIASPRLSGPAVALIGFGVSTAVELLQLTGIPAALLAAVPPLRLVFGSSFDALDLVGYAVGAVLLLFVHGAALRSARSSTRRATGRSVGRAAERSDQRTDQHAARSAEPAPGPARSDERDPGPAGEREP